MSESESGPPRRKVRWWPAVAIVAGGATLVSAIQLIPESVTVFDSANRFLATTAAIVLTSFLLSIWFIFFAGLRTRIRIGLVLAVVSIFAGLAGSGRFEGTDGSMRPRWVWRWSSRAARNVRAGAVDKVAIPAHADLSTTTETDFPQFLGPERLAHVISEPFGLDWTVAPPRLVWRQPIGPGWSAFAVVGDYAVTQEQHDDTEAVVCYRRSTGQAIWTHSDVARHDTFLGGLGPRATPTIHEGRVYTLGATGILNYLDGATGKQLWSHNIVKDHGAKLPDWGKSCSPLVVDNLVVVSAGGPNGHSLVAYDKVSGAEIWHAGDDLSSYASPELATLAGQRQIVMLNGPSVTGHDPSTGAVWWRYVWEGNQPKVPQPIQIADDRLLISAGYGLGCQVLTVKHQNDAWSVSKVWANKQLKPKFTNLVVRDGFAYGLDDGVALVCLDLATGNRKWKAGRYGHGQILLLNDVLLIQAEDGNVALVEANPGQHRELTRFQALVDQTWNNPVISGRYLLVRNAHEAACYELPVK